VGSGVNLYSNSY